MPNRNYPEGHPCYGCADHETLKCTDPVTGRCIECPPGPDGCAAGCPPGQQCVNGDCVESAEIPTYMDFLDNIEGAFGEVDRDSENLPYPVVQFDEPSAHALIRSKIITNKGVSLYIHDHLSGFAQDPFKRFLDTTQIIDLFERMGIHQNINWADSNGLYYDFPFICDFYNLSRRGQYYSQFNLGDNAPTSRLRYDSQEDPLVENPDPMLVNAEGNVPDEDVLGRLNPRSYPAEFMDPLRWAAGGKVWMYTPSILQPWNMQSEYDTQLRFYDTTVDPIESSARNRLNFLRVRFDNPNLGLDSAGGEAVDNGARFEYSFVFDAKQKVFGYNNFISLSFQDGLGNPGIKSLVYEEGSTYLEEEVWIDLDGDLWKHPENNSDVMFPFMYDYFSGATIAPGATREQIIYARLVGNSSGGGMIGSPPEYAKTYRDFAHQVKMPIFERENKQVGFSNKLSADVVLYSNTVSGKAFCDASRVDNVRTEACPSDVENYKNFEGSELELTNVYRYYRSQVNKEIDPNCSDENYLDEILKFTSKNVSKHFDDIASKYARVFPMTVKIQFDTVQSNIIADMFRDHGMGRYFLDVWEKYESDEDAFDGSAYPVSGLEATNKTINLDMFGKSSIANGSMLFTEFLEQIAELPTETGDRYVDRNYWTIGFGNRTTLTNEKIHFRSPRINSNLVSFARAILPVESMQNFDYSMFPLGAFPVDDRLDYDSGWSIGVNQLASRLFLEKLQNIVWKEYNDMPGDVDNQPGRDNTVGDYNTVKGKFRTFQDILDGKKAYSEVIAYVVRKYDITDAEPRLVQKFYLMDSSDIREVNLLDSQVKYNRKYRYYISAITLVIGNEYKYAIEQDQGPDGWPGIFGMLVNPDMAGANLIVGNETSEYYDSRRQEDAPIKIKLKVRSKPSIIFVEVPYFRKTVVTIDRPPLPPQVDLVPYKAEDIGIDGYKHDTARRILLNLTPSSGLRKDHPIGMGLQNDPIIMRNMIDSQDARIKSVDHTDYERFQNSASSELPIEYGNDSLPDSYTVFVVENPESSPISYDDFRPQNGAKVFEYTATYGSLHVDFPIAPNVEYYMCFRANDSVAGFSNPTIVYYVQLVQYADGIYLIAEEYDFPQFPRIDRRRFKRNIKVSLHPDWLELARRGNSSSGPLANKSYRMRIKSKRTGKTVDIDFKYNLKEVVVSPPQECSDDQILVNGECVPIPSRTRCGNVHDWPIYTSEDYIAWAQNVVIMQQMVQECDKTTNVELLPPGNVCTNLSITGETRGGIASPFPMSSIIILEGSQYSEQEEGCRCPPGTVSITDESLNGGSGISRSLLTDEDWMLISSAAKGCIALERINEPFLCPAGQEAVWLPPSQTSQISSEVYYIGCRCIEGLDRCGPCGSTPGPCVDKDCTMFDPDDSQQGRWMWDEASCSCVDRCPHPNQIYNKETQSCECPPGMFQPTTDSDCIPEPTETEDKECVPYNPCLEPCSEGLPCYDLHNHRDGTHRAIDNPDFDWSNAALSGCPPGPVCIPHASTQLGLFGCTNPVWGQPLTYWTPAEAVEFGIPELEGKLKSYIECELPCVGEPIPERLAKCRCLCVDTTIENIGTVDINIIDIDTNTNTPGVGPGDGAAAIPSTPGSFDTATEEDIQLIGTGPAIAALDPDAVGPNAEVADINGVLVEASEVAPCSPPEGGCEALLKCAGGEKSQWMPQICQCICPPNNSEFTNPVGGTGFGPLGG